MEPTNSRRLEYDDDGRDVWERQSGETSGAFAAFVVYRDLGPGRTLVEAYRHKTGKKGAQQASGSWKEWYSANLWRERAEAYDRHLDRMRLIGREKRAQRANDRHERLGRQLQRRAVELMRSSTKLVKVTIQETAPDGSVTYRTEKRLVPQLSAEARKWIALGVDIERRALGIPEYVKQELTGPRGGPLEMEVVGMEIVYPEGMTPPDDDPDLYEADDYDPTNPSED